MAIGPFLKLVAPPTPPEILDGFHEDRLERLEFPRHGDRAAPDPATSRDDDERQAAAAAKDARRIEKRLETRVLDPWERYRALSDLIDGYTDLTEAADRKTRFALLIVGALNAVNILIIAKPDLLNLPAHPSKLLVALYLGTYAALSLLLCIHAIGALRPQMDAFFGSITAAGTHDPALPGLRFMGNVISHGADGYYDQWRQAEIGQVNRELAMQVQALAQANIRKYGSLNRVYRGLVALTALTAGLITMVVVASVL